MSIVIQEDQLKGFPDNRLAQLLENPVSEFPPYLVYAELNRRKDLRNRYAQQQAEAPSSTMAEEMVAEVSGIGQAMPPQMMPPGAMPPGAMPPGAMPTQMMRGGGLVRGFSNGTLIRPLSDYEGYSERGGAGFGGMPSFAVGSAAEKEALSRLATIEEQVSRGEVDPDSVLDERYMLQAGLSGPQAMYAGKPGFTATVPRIPVLGSIGTSIYEMTDRSRAEAAGERISQREKLRQAGFVSDAPEIDPEPGRQTEFTRSPAKGVRRISPEGTSEAEAPDAAATQTAAERRVGVAIPKGTRLDFIEDAKSRAKALSDEAETLPTGLDQVYSPQISAYAAEGSDMRATLGNIERLQGGRDKLFQDLKSISSGIPQPDLKRAGEARAELLGMSEYPGKKSFDEYIEALKEDKGRDSSSIDKLRKRLEELTPAPNKDVTTGMALLGLGRGLLSAPTFAEGLAAGIPDVQQAVTARQQDLKDYNKNRQLAEQALFDVEEERSRRREDRMFQARTAGLDVEARAADYALGRAKALSDIDLAVLDAQTRSKVAEAGLQSDIARLETGYETDLARLQADLVNQAAGRASDEAIAQAKLDFDASSLTAKLESDQSARMFNAARDAERSFLAAQSSMYTADASLARSVLDSLSDSIDELQEQRKIFVTLSEPEEVGKIDNMIRKLSGQRNIVLERFSPKRLAVPTPER